MWVAFRLVRCASEDEFLSLGQSSVSGDRQIARGYSGDTLPQASILDLLLPVVAGLQS